MKESQNVKWIVRIVGGLSILAGAYFAFTGAIFQEYFYSILIGASLFAASFQSRKKEMNPSDSSSSAI